MFVRKIIHDDGYETKIYKLPDGRLISCREYVNKIGFDTYNAIIQQTKEMRERDSLRD